MKASGGQEIILLKNINPDVQNLTVIATIAKTIMKRTANKILGLIYSPIISTMESGIKNEINIHINDEAKSPITPAIGTSFKGLIKVSNPKTIKKTLVNKFRSFTF